MSCGSRGALRFGALSALLHFSAFLHFFRPGPAGLFPCCVYKNVDRMRLLNGIKISQKKQKNKVFPTANTKESVKR
jgi:hypothetical protein